jgi:glycosyl transferase family 92
MTPDLPVYLSVCAIYRNEAPYLAEWIEFHRLVGAERFFLYDNASTDEHEQVLKPYVSEGTLAVHHWPEHPGQASAYAHCLSEHGGESRWIAFIDLDEFLFSPDQRPLPELLVEYEQWPGVGVNRAVFGTSGHKHKPDGLVIESYIKRFRNRGSIKSIVDPSRAEYPLNPHAFTYRDDASAVDEYKRPIEGWMTDEFTFERLRINHYYTRSEDEFEVKLEHERADNAKLRNRPKNPVGLSGGDPDQVITAYVPALKAAIADRAVRLGR